MLPAVRFVRWTVLASVWVTIVVSVVLAGRSPSSPQSMSALFGGGTEQTPWGPLGPADRDMLIKVRQANLWEGPVAEQAAQRATSPAVREVGRKIALEHAQLDADLRTVAAKLNLALPSQPSDQQKVWLAQITGASAANFDKTFVNLVRSAHGEVMPLVEGSRSGTQNELVRQFGIEASQFIGRHMDYLESTGLVDYALFPASTAPVARLSAIGGYNVPVTLLLFVMAVLVSGALLRGMSQPRPGARRTEQGAWWRRAGRAAGGPALSALSVLSGQSRRRRAAAEHTVTTAELIAVLNPPSAHGGGELVSGEGAAVIPAGASALGLVPEPTPPDLVAARRTGPRVTADVLGATAGSALDTTGARRPGHVPSQRVGAPVQAGLAARTASAELPVPSSHRVTRAVWAAEAAPHGAPVDRKSAERKPTTDRKPPKLGRATRCRPW